MIEARGTRRRSRAVVVAIVAGWGVASGCVSLAGLTGGKSTDDAGRKPDAHVITISLDGAPDQTAGDGSGEAATDGGIEAGRVDGGAGDAGCAPFGFDAGGPVACPPSDAGSCLPVSLPDATFPTRATGQKLNACTPELIAGFIASCIDGAATNATCSTYLSTAQALVCAQCIDTDVSATSYGPIISFGGVATLNTGGCIGLIEPCERACAAANQAELLCNLASCATSCERDASVTSAQLSASEDCASAAGSCACAPEQSFANACNQQLMTSPKTSGCFPGSRSFEATLAKLASLFCYNGSLDAGSTDAGS